MYAAAGRTADEYIALAIGLQVVRAGLQLVAGDLQHDLARLLGGHDDGIANPVGGPAGESAHAVRPGVGIGRVDHHIFDRQAQGLGPNLGQNCLQALTQIGTGKADDEGARRGGMDQGLAWIAAQVHAGRVIDGRDARSFYFSHDFLLGHSSASP